MARPTLGMLLGLSLPVAFVAACFYDKPWALFLWAVAAIAYSVTSGRPAR